MTCVRKAFPLGGKVAVPKAPTDEGPVLPTGKNHKGTECTPYRSVFCAFILFCAGGESSSLT